MNSNNQEIVNTVDVLEKNKLFFEINQKTFDELLTFLDFVDNQLNIGLVEINFERDRDDLITALIRHPDYQHIQFEILDFPDSNLRFLRDELVDALKQIKVTPDKELVLLITGLERSIGVVEEYPAVLANLNYVRDDLTYSVPHPIIFFLPDYALTRLAKYAPDFWAWNRKLFKFKTVQSTIDTRVDSNVFYESNLSSFSLKNKKERIDLLLRLLSEYRCDQKLKNQHNLLILINLYTQLGIAYYSIRNYKQAIRYHQESLDISIRLNNLPGKASSLNNLGNIYYSQEKYQKAIEFHQQSLKINQKTGDRYGEASTLNNLGNTYHCLKKYQKAIEFHQQSLQIKKQIGNRNGEAISLNNLGNAYDSLGESQQAIKLHQQSLSIFQQIGNRYGEANTLNNLGIAYNSLGESQQAIKFYKQSLSIFQQIGNRYGEAISWFNLGIAWENLQQSLEIKVAYEKARKLFKEIRAEKYVKECDRALQELE